MSSLWKFVPPFLALTTVLAGVLAWKKHEAYLDLEASFEKKLNDERGAMEQRVADAERRARELEDELAARMAPVDPTAAMAATEPRPAATPPANRDRERERGRGENGQGGRRNVSFNEVMSKNPELARLVTAQQRASLDERYAGLFKALNLNSADLEKFQNLLVEKQNTYRDVTQAAREKGLNMREHGDDIRKLVDQANAEIDQTMKATLGDQVFNQYQKYEQTGAQRNLVDQLDRRLSYNGGRLQDQQTQQLVDILAANPVPRPTTEGQGGRGGGGNWNNASRMISDSAVQQASKILAPHQLAALQQLQAEQRARQQIQQLFRQATQPATRTSTNPAPATK